MCMLTVSHVSNIRLAGSYCLPLAIRPVAGDLFFSEFMLVQGISDDVLVGAVAFFEGICFASSLQVL